MRNLKTLVLTMLVFCSCEDSGLPIFLSGGAGGPGPPSEAGPPVFANAQTGDVTLQSAQKISFLKSNGSRPERVLLIGDGTAEALYAIDVSDQDPDNNGAFPYDDYTAIPDIRAPIAATIGGGAMPSNVTINSIVKNPNSHSLFAAVEHMSNQRVFILSSGGGGLSVRPLDTGAVSYVKINIESESGTALNMTNHSSIATTEGMFALSANAGMNARIASQQIPLTHDSHASLTTASICISSWWGRPGMDECTITGTPMVTLVLYESQRLGETALMGSTLCNPYQSIPISDLEDGGTATAEVHFHVGIGGGSPDDLVLLGSGTTAQALAIETEEAISIPYSIFDGDNKDDASPNQPALRPLFSGTVPALWSGRGVQSRNNNVKYIIPIDDSNVLFLSTTDPPRLVRLTL